MGAFLLSAIYLTIVMSGNEDAPWGARMCRLQDPDHYIWCVHEPVIAK